MMKKFICIPYDDRPCQYLCFSEIESIETSTLESPPDSNERKSGFPYRARVVFITRSGREIDATLGLDTNRQINLKRLLKNLTIRL
jgi:hypothetical protein